MDFKNKLEEIFNDGKTMMTSNEEEFNKYINELNKEYAEYTLMCDKTNCGCNFCGKCTLESPNRNFDNCDDFFTIE